MIRKIFLTGTLIVSVGLFSNAQTIKFEKEIIDYGIVKKGSNKERIFKFINSGDKPLILSEVTATCGCTIPSYPKEPILPGKSSEIKVSYDTNKIGVFTKPITVMSNDIKNPRKIITIKGEIK